MSYDICKSCSQPTFRCECRGGGGAEELVKAAASMLRALRAVEACGSLLEAKRIAREARESVGIMT
jgi:hypothetical protein